MDEQNNRHDEIEESIAARRLRRLSPESVTEQGYGTIAKDRSFANFWYHYKWHTLAVIAVVVMLAILIPQCAMRRAPDVQILYAGPWSGGGRATEMTALNDAFLSLGQDYNGDGEVYFTYNTISLLTDEQYQAIIDEYKGRPEEAPYIDAGALRQNHQFFWNEVQSGEAVICLLDPAWYEALGEDGWLMPFSEFLGYTPTGALDDGCGILLSATDFGRHFPGIKNLPDDTLLCIKRTGAILTNVNPDRVATYRGYAKELLTSILNFSIE